MSYWSEWSDADVQRCAVKVCQHMRGDHSLMAQASCLQSSCPCHHFVPSGEE